jgi:hypothetical protein
MPKPIRKSYRIASNPTKKAYYRKMVAKVALELQRQWINDDLSTKTVAIDSGLCIETCRKMRKHETLSPKMESMFAWADALGFDMMMSRKAAGGNVVNLDQWKQMGGGAMRIKRKPVKKHTFKRKVVAR